MKHNKIFIYGKHAVLEALQHAPQALTKVYFDRKAADSKLRLQLERSGVALAPLSEGLARSDMKSGTAHQGIVGQLSIPQLMRPYQQFIEHLEPAANTGLLLMAGLEDPHNVGAVIRSAAAFGFSGVLMPATGQAPVTGAVAKASAGMAFRIPLVEIAGAEQAISDLKKRGFMVCGLTGEGARAVGDEPFAKPTVFVLGNEGLGLPAHLRDRCDTLLTIPMHPRAESLNVAAAAAVALFAWSARHPQALV